MENKQIYDFAFEYVLNKSEIKANELQLFLEQWKYKKVDGLSNICEGILDSAVNKQGMANSIGKKENFANLICNFNPHEIVKKFNNWEDIFDTINENYTNPPSKMVKENNRSYWVRYCKCIYSTSTFLCRFRNFAEFENYVNSFVKSNNPDLRIAFPLLIPNFHHPSFANPLKNRQFFQKKSISVVLH